MQATMTNSTIIYGREFNKEGAIGMYLVPDGWRFGSRLEASDWDKAKFYLPTNSGGPVKAIAVNVKITGRTLQRICGDLFVRCQIEFVGDGEPSTFTGGWLKAE